MNLWASTDLILIDLPDGQPFPFYYRPADGRLRLLYRVTPDFCAWLLESVARALRGTTPVSPEDLLNVREIQAYCADKFSGIPGVANLPQAVPAETCAAVYAFVDANDKFLSRKDFIAWRPMA